MKSDDMRPVDRQVFEMYLTQRRLLRAGKIATRSSWYDEYEQENPVFVEMANDMEAEAVNVELVTNFIRRHEEG